MRRGIFFLDDALIYMTFGLSKLIFGLSKQMFQEGIIRVNTITGINKLGLFRFIKGVK